jgi:hypothetical protein
MNRKCGAGAAARHGPDRRRRRGHMAVLEELVTRPGFDKKAAVTVRCSATN